MIVSSTKLIVVIFLSFRFPHEDHHHHLDDDDDEEGKSMTIVASMDFFVMIFLPCRFLNEGDDDDGMSLLIVKWRMFMIAFLSYPNAADHIHRAVNSEKFSTILHSLFTLRTWMLFSNYIVVHR